jgi:hypothetical protein
VCMQIALEADGDVEVAATERLTPQAGARP